MAEAESELQVKRVFEQPEDALSIYADYVQIVSTENQVLMQFYDVIPGIPKMPGSKIDEVRTRLRATVALTPKVAKEVTRILVQHTGEKA